MVALIVGLFNPDYIFFGYLKSRWLLLLFFLVAFVLVGILLFFGGGLIITKLLKQADQLWDHGRKSDAIKIFLFVLETRDEILKSKGLQIALRFLDSGQKYHAFKVCRMVQKAKIDLPRDLIEKLDLEEKPKGRPITIPYPVKSICNFCEKNEPSDRHSILLEILEYSSCSVQTAFGTPIHSTTTYKHYPDEVKVPACQECEKKIRDYKRTNKEIKETLAVKEANKQMERTGLGLFLDRSRISSIAKKGVLEPIL